MNRWGCASMQTGLAEGWHRCKRALPDKWINVASGWSATRRKVHADCSREVLSVVSGVHRRRTAGEQDEADRRRIPDTTTCTKPLEKAMGIGFQVADRRTCRSPLLRPLVAD